ncbi:zinc ABC transporter substrate-binding protein ZnuA [Vibrio paucivorans]|uniref:High-affinity zinc uptake system protein ZnuA n=1 Tax=Vibrio paucivorans TaxID=2829489 RepID=A0A9X3CC69_9VIBR|nr:zinc ABC transporter substrate-binding protein ZnuA [Vibrio paucivorans]MCW8333077.1 zinc ABC transporter substrate-binding protein ZnuA [Vibrio paucivorans]
MKKLLPLLLLPLAIAPTVTWAKTVLTSIKPIQMITYELTEGVAEPEVLLSTNTSPHDYALKPSDVKRVRQADLVIWYGHDLEPFLEKVLESQPKVLTLSDIPNLKLREYADGAHAHEGHDHGSHDPHFWLGNETTVQVAQAIAAKLANIDPENKATYEANLAAFLAEMAKVKKDIDTQLFPIKEQGYYVFHDAYGYFESDYGLNHLGYFTVSPERKPGAKTLISIRTALKNDEVKCVFSEPQFTPAVIESVTRGSSVDVGVLDPIGSEIPVQSGSYFTFLTSMASDFSDCLSK